MKNKYDAGILTYTPLNFPQECKTAIKKSWFQKAQIPPNYSKVADKTIDFLFDQTDKNGFVPGTVQEIADTFNLSRGLVVKCIKMFEKASLVHKGYGHTRILHIQKYIIIQDDI